MAVTRLGSAHAKPFAKRIKAAPFQRDLLAKVEPIRNIIERGLIVDSPDIGVEKLPDGRLRLRLKNRIGAPAPTVAVTAGTELITPNTYTEFFCKSGGSNLNAGGDHNNAEPSTSPLYSSTNGNYNATTNVYTPADGSTPANSVAVGDWASVYNDGATVGVWVARVTAVAAGVNGAITLSTTALAGTEPITSATLRSIRVGGAWLGPNGASGFPFTLAQWQNLQDAAGDGPRINLKNDHTYSVTAAIGDQSATTGRPGCLVQGYSSIPGDGGQATIDGGTSGSYTTFLFQGSANGPNMADIIFQNNGASGTPYLLGLTAAACIVRCVFKNARGVAVHCLAPNWLVDCEASNCNLSNAAGVGIFNSNVGDTLFTRCYAHDSAGSNCHGFKLVNSPCSLTDCTCENLGGHGVLLTGAGTAVNYIGGSPGSGCKFINLTGAGVKCTAGAGVQRLIVENSTFQNCAGGEIDMGAAANFVWTGGNTII